jgi:hypothetical protein
MPKHLEEYFIKEPQHRYVLLEKRIKPVEFFINSIKDAGWEDIVFFEKNLVLITNERTKQILLLSCSENEIFKNVNNFTLFSTYNLGYETKNIYVSLIFDIRYGEITKNFKIPDFIKWYISSISTCKYHIKTIKEILKNFENGYINSKEIETKFMETRLILETKNKELTNFFYNKNIEDFFA